MQNVEFGVKRFDGKSVLAIALLTPALLWWAALAISLAAVSGLAELLGNSIMQVVALVICPLLAVIVSLATSRASKMRWMIALAGMLLTALAFLASFRIS